MFTNSNCSIKKIKPITINTEQAKTTTTEIWVSSLEQANKYVARLD